MTGHGSPVTLAMPQNWSQRRTLPELYLSKALSEGKQWRLRRPLPTRLRLTSVPRVASGVAPEKLCEIYEAAFQDSPHCWPLIHFNSFAIYRHPGLLLAFYAAYDILCHLHYMNIIILIHFNILLKIICKSRKVSKDSWQYIAIYCSKILRRLLGISLLFYRQNWKCKC